jgi:predicted  nucleic acid-binding Zn-ribbon protein
MANDRNATHESNDYHAWLDTFREAMRSSIGEVEDTFDEKERLRKQIGGLRQGKVALEAYMAPETHHLLFIENAILANNIKELQDERASLEAENDRLRRQVREMSSTCNSSVDELAANLDRIDIDTDSTGKQTQFA